MCIIYTVNSQRETSYLQPMYIYKHVLPIRLCQMFHQIKKKSFYLYNTFQEERH